VALPAEAAGGEATGNRSPGGLLGAEAGDGEVAQNIDDSARLVPGVKRITDIDNDACAVYRFDSKYVLFWA